MTEIHGGLSASAIVGRFVELVNESLIGSSYLSERIGDQVVVCSTDVDNLALTAIRLNNLTREENLFLLVHAGIHYGKIVEKDGHFFGSTINTAARIAATAKGGQVLCSESFVDQLRMRESYTLSEVGVFEFKNMISKIRIFEIVSVIPSHQVPLRDPVCHMLITAPKEELTYLYRGHLVHFCSIECLNTFKNSLQAMG
jgi:adenylate cyclase